MIVNQFNNTPPVNRHFVLLPQQQQQIAPPPSLMYASPVHNFHLPYPGNMPSMQHQLMFIPSRPQAQQSWILPSSPATSMPTFIQSHPTTFHHMQPPLPPPQPSFSGGSGMSQPSFASGTGIPQPPFSGGTSVSQPPFNGGTNVSQPSLGSGTGIPQPAFSGGTAVLKRKSHYLDESEYDSPVSLLGSWKLLKSEILYPFSRRTLIMANRQTSRH